MGKRRASAPVVVIGGGFGGVFTAYHLTAGAPRGGRVPVTLVSHDDAFVFKPLLPEAIGGVLESKYVMNSLPKLAKEWGFEFVHAAAQDVDTEHHVVLTSKGERPYRDLVVATGSVVADHGLNLNAPGVFTLHHLHDVERLRKHVAKQVDRAVRARSERARATALTFLCVGGGPTGVETLCEIQELAQSHLAAVHATHHIADLQCVIIEAGRDILPTMSAALRHDVRTALKRRGVLVETGTPVIELDAEGCRLADGRVYHGGTIVWAAGIRAHPFVRALQRPTDMLGRVQVDNFLRPRGAINVFALGDSACFIDPKTGGPVPATGQVAVQEAKTVATNVLRRRRRRPLQVFKYTELGQLVPLGGSQALGYVLGRRVEGTTGWFASRAAYFTRVLGLDNRLGLAWGWGRHAMAQALVRPLWR